MDMGVGVGVPVRMPMVVGTTVRLATGMVVLMSVGRGGNHAKDVIL